MGIIGEKQGKIVSTETPKGDRSKGDRLKSEVPSEGEKVVQMVAVDVYGEQAPNSVALIIHRHSQ